MCSSCRFSPSVSPHLIVEAARQWLNEATNGSKLERVVFSAKANCSLVEKHMDDYFPLQPFASHGRTESEASESDKTKEGMEAGELEPYNQEGGMENEVVELDQLQNGIQCETQVLERNSVSDHSEAICDSEVMARDKRVSTVSIGAIDFEMDDESTLKHEDPIPEDMEEESDKADSINGTSDVNMDNIELELEGVDAEMSNIQSILLEMQQKQQELDSLGEEEEEEGDDQVDDEDPIGLLKYLGKRSNSHEIMNASASLSAHTSPLHMNLLSAEMQKLSQSLPLLDDEMAIGSPTNFRLNPGRVESDV